MGDITRLKTFTNPNHRALEDEFNLWSTSFSGPINVMDTSMTYSAALQKFVMSVVYYTGGYERSSE